MTPNKDIFHSMSNFDEKKGGQHVATDAPTYQKFARDKRVRTTGAVRVEPVSRRENSDRADREGRTFNRDERNNFKRSYNNDRTPRQSEENRARASYNPNFTRDNRPMFQSERNDEERPRRQFNRDGERQHRTFNRDGEQRSFNRDYNRDFNRENSRENHRSEYRSYNSFRSEQSGEERPRRSFNHDGERQHRTFNRDGGHRNFNRDHNHSGEHRSFKRDFNHDGERRSFNREERQGGFRQRSEEDFRQRNGEERSFNKRTIRTKTAYSAGEIPESYPRFAAPQQDGEIRLNRYIAQSGLCSRREADELIADGKVTVNGVVVTEMGSKVQPTDEVCVNDSRVVSEKKVYILMNKPKGFVTTVEDDLQYHAKGCYSAVSEIKSNNRMAENMLTEAEKYSVLAESLLGVRYPVEDIKKAWNNVLFNQFHDILGGCSIKEAYKDARWAHGESLNIASRVSNNALVRIAQNIDTCKGMDITAEKKEFIWVNKCTEGLGIPLIVFNPLPYEVTKVVNAGYPAKAVKTDEGTHVPVQMVRASKTLWDNKFETAFVANVPALGYKVYRLHITKNMVLHRRPSKKRCVI